jgi:hypothetical protein
MNNGRSFGLQRAIAAAEKCSGSCNQGRACDCVSDTEPAYAEFSAAWGAELGDRYDDDGRVLRRWFFGFLAAILIAGLLAVFA